MGKVLAKALEKQPLGDPARLEPLIPEQTTELLDVGVAVMAQQWDRIQAIPKPWADDIRAEAARTANNLANRLSAVGERQAALAPAEEAAGLYRELAANEPAAYRPALAIALNTLAISLSEAGQREVALAPAQEAADLDRELAAKAPDAYRPALAGSLAVLANCLEAKGDLAAALERTQEAIEIYRPYFLAQPPAFVHWMAPMYQQYVERCERFGREPDEALLGPIAAALQGMQKGSGDDMQR